MAAAPPHRDPRRFIYVAIDLALTAGYLALLLTTLRNRHGWAQAVLYVLPVGTTLMAIGTGFGRRWGWWLTLAGGTTLLLWTVGFIILLLSTAAYLSGVYGAFGKAAVVGGGPRGGLRDRGGGVLAGAAAEVGAHPRRPPRLRARRPRAAA
jgi:hypothetical protein